MTPPRRPLVLALRGALVVGGCLLLLLLTRLASGPVLALLRRVSGSETIGASVYWSGALVVMLGAPLAGWWVDRAGRRAGLVVGVALVAAALTLLTFLNVQAWAPLYVLMAFGVVLIGVSATTLVATLARRVALATVIALCLPYVRVTPAVSPGMQALLTMGDRAFAVLGVAFLIAAALPLAAIGLGYALERKQLAEAAPEPIEPAAGPAVLDGNQSLVLIALVGWVTQVGAAAADLSRALPQQAVDQSILPLVGVLVAGLMSYVWAILADATTPRPAPGRTGWPTATLLAVAFFVCAAGVGLVLASRGAASFSLGMFVAGVGAAGVVPIAVAGHLRGIDAASWAGAVGFSMAAFVFGQLAGARVNVYLAAWAGPMLPLGASAVVAIAAGIWLSRQARQARAAAA